jgi:hypothetical protein
MMLQTPLPPHEVIDGLKAVFPNLDEALPFSGKPDFYSRVSGHDFRLHCRRIGFVRIDGQAADISGGTQLRLEQVKDWPTALACWLGAAIGWGLLSLFGGFLFGESQAKYPLDHSTTEWFFAYIFWPIFLIPLLLYIWHTWIQLQYAPKLLAECCERLQEKFPSLTSGSELLPEDPRQVKVEARSGGYLLHSIVDEDTFTLQLRREVEKLQSSQAEWDTEYLPGGVLRLHYHFRGRNPQKGFHALQLSQQGERLVLAWTTPLAQSQLNVFLVIGAIACVVVPPTASLAGGLGPLLRSPGWLLSIGLIAGALGGSLSILMRTSGKAQTDWLLDLLRKAMTPRQ